MPCRTEDMYSYGENQPAKHDCHTLCLLDELKGKKFNQRHWDGYHPKVYHCSTYDGKRSSDAFTARLCAQLKDKDVTRYSLEMQVWWRDHQKADKARLKKKAEKVRLAKARVIALDKLSAHDRKVLGLTAHKD